ncbi:uncharacterized protein [Coffea arabica]|uniref:Reverse transcriptase zinc-binding domain-containing protein n=1 Tax=Coffea arabica TaxID=13443 RepID=A0ABM4VZB3_COFAR
MIWEGSPSGNFSVSTELEGPRQKQNVSLVSQFIWSPALPTKISFFAWRLVRRWVPLDVQLQRKGVHLGSMCSCCGGARETVEHLFVTGPVAVSVWGHFGQQFGISWRGAPGVSSLLVGWFLSHRMVKANHIRVLVPMAALWFIWRSRNQARFEGSRMRADHIIWEVGNLMEFLGEAQKLGRSFQGDEDCIWARGRRRVGVCRQSMLVAWSRPPAQGLKLNTDASVTSLGAFGGGVARSSEGRVIFAFYKEFGDVSVLHAAALALLSGLVYCLDRAISGVRAESDSAALVRMLASGAPASWPLCNVLRKIRFLLQELGGSLGHVIDDEHDLRINPSQEDRNNAGDHDEEVVQV